MSFDSPIYLGDDEEPIDEPAWTYSYEGQESDEEFEPDRDDKNKEKQKKDSPEGDTDWKYSEDERESDGGEEYQPDKKDKKKAKKKKKSPDGDADWKYSEDERESDGDEEYEPDTEERRRDRGPLLRDDNNTKTFLARLASIRDTDPDDLVVTRNVKSEEFGESTAPWRVNRQIWEKLHDFQKEGVSWLQKKTDHRSGGILADEMGLGKTIQTAVFLRSIDETGRTHYKYKGLDTCLIVCHVSIIAQWIQALHEWFPKVRVFLLHSNSSTGRGSQWEESVFRKLNHRDQQFPNGCVVLTTYAMFTKLKKPLVRHPWQVVILDEGHFIRNEDTKCSQAMKQLMTTQRFILTGTPFQNRLSEFWKLVDFVHPGRLSDSATFHRNFTQIINAGANLNCSPQAAAKAYECLVALHRAVKPLILRRLQEDHKDVLCLPEKNELILSCELSKRQRRIYEEYASSREVESIKEGRIKAFIGITKLGDICNHPGIYRGLSPTNHKFGGIKDSGKVAMVFKLFNEWFKNPKNRVVFFTQRVKVIEMMGFFLEQRGIRYVSMTGSDTASARPKTIQQFEEDPDIKVFLMTTRTGGLGLNLTCANKAVIFDPDWNPQADNQAKNRIYRMGQESDVSIVRLISNGTIEDRKFFKQVQKETLAAQLLHNSDVQHAVPNNTLHDLFRLKPAGLEGSEIGIYMQGEIAPENALKSENKKSAKKAMKNKLAGFEDKKLLLSLFDDDKLVAMRQHSIKVQNSSDMNRVQKQKMRSDINKAVGSLIHTEGRLARTWKNEFHKFLNEEFKLPVSAEFFVEKEETDNYWATVHSQIRANDDRRELNRLVQLAKNMHHFLNGVPSASEQSIHRIFVKKHDQANPTQMFFIQEIIATLATYDEETGRWSIRPEYKITLPETPLKRKSPVMKSTSDIKKARRSLTPKFVDEPSTSADHPSAPSTAENREIKESRRSLTPKFDNEPSTSNDYSCDPTTSENPEDSEEI